MKRRLDPKLAKLLAETLQRITPGRIPAPVTTLFKRVEQSAEKIGATAVLGGSLAKGTHLKGDHDVDIFVRFAEDGALSDQLEKILPKRAARVHGSRDYFHLEQDGYLFEIVPVLDITTHTAAKNVTDMSPLHITYVRDALEKRPELAQEIRLAKQFCKAAKVYGAESYINGLSGHVLDLLIIHYGSFLKLLSTATVWGAQVSIDPARHHENALAALDKAKHGPLIIVDPVQPERNAAAALSTENFTTFKEAARHFLQKPTAAAFTITPLTTEEIRATQQEGEVFILASQPLQGKQDIVATKLLKIHEHIIKSAATHGFTLLDAGWEFQKSGALHYYAFPEGELSPTVERAGPPLTAKADAARFRKKHAEVTERKGKLYAKVRRTYRRPAKLLQHLLSSSYVRERCKRITVAEVF